MSVVFDMTNFTVVVTIGDVLKKIRNKERALKNWPKHCETIETLSITTTRSVVKPILNSRFICAQLLRAKQHTRGIIVTK